jgi:hypothetical protein
LKDAYAVYAATNFMINMDAAAETRQGNNVANIAGIHVTYKPWIKWPTKANLPRKDSLNTSRKIYYNATSVSRNSDCSVMKTI